MSLAQLKQFSVMCEKLSDVGARDDSVRQIFHIPVPKPTEIGILLFIQKSLSITPASTRDDQKRNIFPLGPAN